MVLAAAALMSSCQLFYNPDFTNKTLAGSSPTNNITPMSEIIGPGVTNFTGTYTSYVKGYNVYVSIDGGTSMLATMNYPTWTTGSLNLSCGPHKVTVQLEDSSGNVKDSKNFIYNVPAYVATSGSDTANKGNTPASPFLSLQAGADSVTNLMKVNACPGYVYVAAGTYTPGSGLNNAPLNGLILNAPHSYINILGGFVNNYQSRSGICVLDEGNVSASRNVIQISGSTAVIIDSFILCRAGNCLGMFINNAYNNILTNLIISNNLGGIYINNSSGNIISAGIYNNSPKNPGGGIYMTGSFNNTINGIISNNYSQHCSGGGIYISGGYNNTINTTITCNYVYTADGGGGLLLTNEYNDIINGNIISNSSSGVNGGGIAIENGSNITVNGIISNNYSSVDGGGIYLTNSYGNIINALVTCNSANYGGGIYAIDELKDILNASVISNATAGQAGGGYCIFSSTNVTINGSIISNSSAQNGGGLFISIGYGNIISAIVAENFSLNIGGGGIYLNNETNDVINGPVTNNSANGNNGGGIYSYKSAYINNAIVTGNSPDNIVNQ